MFTVLVSALVVVAHGLLYDHHMLLTATPFTLWGLTLAIFLAFRNNVAYQRFWEARTLWGELLIVSRNLARQSRVLLPSLPAEQRGRLVRLLVVFSYALRDMLRGQPTGADIQRVFGDEADTLPTSPTRCSVSPAAG